ncbi:type II secretion system protein GspM [Candidatus Thiosymbion oneisti]|uniref:type II secretion system protein GspM n=1 Tax=Candidatus Thiosymbion oneisti TaxID=589554 RepID=UPI000B7FCDC7|nr:type II secretion system protein GspM [Candidatus Thiosymbion oneisti]
MSERTDHKGICVLAWLGVLAIPVGLVFAIGWPWLERVKALEREIASLDERIVRHQGLLRTLPGLQAELKQVSDNKDVKNFYFDAKTSALAGAELQRQVKKMVTSAGGQVMSTQRLPSPKDEQPPRVRVRTQIQGMTDALLDVLYQIEQARPFLFVEKLSVRAPPRQRRPQRRGTRQGLLTVRLDVFGYTLGVTP